MLSPHIKRNIYRIIPFGVIWLVSATVYLLLEKGILGDFSYYPSTGNPYNFEDSIWIALPLAVITGLAIGTFEVIFLSKRFGESSLFTKIVSKTIIYLTVILAFLIISTAATSSIKLESGLLTPQVLNTIPAFVFNFAFLSVVLYIAMSILFSMFYNEVSENIGQQVLINFMTGKYHKPIQEERIFMFLDMKSSTSIAEKIGHVKYFKMLAEYYTDLTDPVVSYQGEIYQYVGDEIIVSWKLKNGISQSNCLRCFFAMKEAIEHHVGRYEERYGVVPTFKAGFHLGTATTGEIGVIKKEIIFTGDVLNTTARIQGLCNTLEKEILISGTLKTVLEAPSPFKFQNMGEHELRGRDEKIALFTVTELVDSR